MSENLVDTAPQTIPGDNRPIFTVSEISQALKRAVEENFANIRVKGEITSLKKAGSGHIYLCLKDEDAVLDGVVWRTTAARLRMAPEDGMEVIATGRLTTYPGRSRYQIVIDSMEIAGQGALLKIVEDRRKKLLAEGLFDAARKKKLPFLPEVIGVVTSPSGAVIRDILHRLRDRFPRHVLVWPVLVQGDGAAEQVAAAIEGFNKIMPGGPVPRPDLLIVARGGGSLEDLWAFNEEIVVRAAAASAIPLISAVGHETDTTLVDFASDVRAPTPTAAAEMAVPVRSELIARVEERSARIVRCMSRTFESLDREIRQLARVLGEPQRLVEEAAERLDDRVERAKRALDALLQANERESASVAARLVTPRQVIRIKEDRFKTLLRNGERAMIALRRDKDAALKSVVRLLNGVSYQRVLDRGFALVTNPDGHAVTEAAKVEGGMVLDIRFRDGRVAATADGEKPSRKVKPPKTSDKQGTLL
jgi:exodeoxyribonuclease VII large subunit